jgi:hypothetical protein
MWTKIMAVPFVGYHSETVELGLNIFIAFHYFSQPIMIYKMWYLSTSANIHATQNTGWLSF